MSVPNSARTKELLKWALKYAQLGFAVYPAHHILSDGKCSCGKTKCKPGKHPVTRHGVKDATSDDRGICQFWQSHPEANVGIATGAVSGIVALDVDPQNGGVESLKKLESEIGPLPRTVRAVTGGDGFHLLFKHPGVAIKSSVGIRPGLDIRGDGTGIIVSPSSHVSGRQYTWEVGAEPGAIPLAEIPSALLQVLTDKTANTSTPMSKLGRPLPEGERNAGLASIAGKLVRACLDPVDLFPALSGINRVRCRPPLDDVEVATIVRSISRYGSAAIDWTSPSKLPSLEREVPTLNKAMLPTVIADWAWDLADRMQCPPEIAAIPVLTVLSSLIGGRTIIRPKKHDPWTEAPNLWGIVISPPSSMKSPCLTEALKVINSLQYQAMEKYRKEKTDFAAEEEAYKTQVEELKKKFKGDIPRLAEELKKALAELLSKKPKAKRFIVNDSTIEKLGEILSENNTGILLFRDELFGFFMNLEKKGHESDRALFLESWAGKSPYTYDRIGRGLVHIKKLCISILGGIQPDRLKQYFDQVLRSGTSDDGLLARFQLAIWPNMPRDFKFVDREADKKLQESLELVFEEIVKWDRDDDHDALVFHFEPDAQRVFDLWYEALQKRLRSGSISSAAFLAHLSKYGSLMPSLALVFCIVDTISEAASGYGVSLRHAEMAVSMCNYLEEHAKKIYAATIYPELAAAHALAKRITSGELFDGMPVREVYRKQWRSLDSSDGVRQGLAVLEKYDWIRVVMVQTTGDQGGAPSEVVRVNPAVCAFAREIGVDA